MNNDKKQLDKMVFIDDVHGDDFEADLRHGLASGDTGDWMEDEIDGIVRAVDTRLDESMDENDREAVIEMVVEHGSICLVDMDAATQLMDDEIREALHAELAPCDPLIFLRAYEVAHEEKHGEEFCVE